IPDVAPFARPPKARRQIRSVAQSAREATASGSLAERLGGVPSTVEHADVRHAGEPESQRNASARFTPASAVDNNGAAGRPLREKLRQQRIPIVLVKKRGSFHVIGGILRLRPRIHPKKWRGPRAQFPGGDELATGSGSGGARAPAARRLQLPLH